MEKWFQEAYARVSAQGIDYWAKAVCRDCRIREARPALNRALRARQGWPEPLLNRGVYAIHQNLFYTDLHVEIDALPLTTIVAWWQEVIQRTNVPTINLEFRNLARPERPAKFLQPHRPAVYTTRHERGWELQKGAICHDLGFSEEIMRREYRIEGAYLLVNGQVVNRIGQPESEAIIVNGQVFEDLVRQLLTANGL